MKPNRRTIVHAAALACLAGVAGNALAQLKEVEIAIIDGLTGPYATNGSRVIKGAEMAAEEMPKEGLEGTAVFTNVWPTKNSGDLEARWKQRTGQPWMTFDPAFGYGHVYLLKESIERAGSTDRAKLAEALRTIKLESGPAVAGLNGPVSFDATGKRVNPPVALLQWQNGVPVAIYPADIAVAQPLKATQ